MQDAGSKLTYPGLSSCATRKALRTHPEPHVARLTDVSGDVSILDEAGFSEDGILPERRTFE
jgi:hypothetical protein